MILAAHFTLWKIVRRVIFYSECQVVPHTHFRAIKHGNLFFPCMNNSVWIGLDVSSYQCIIRDLWYTGNVTNCGCWTQIYVFDFSVCLEPGIKPKPMKIKSKKSKSRMVPLSLSWSFGAVLGLCFSSLWPHVQSTLSPENEVPLRPTTWLPEGKLTHVSLPKGRTVR